MPCSPGMTACKATCAHREFVKGYRDEVVRHRDEALERSGGYDTELAEYYRDNPAPQFKDWLIHNRGSNRAPEDTVEIPQPPPPIVEEQGLLATALAFRSRDKDELVGLRMVQPGDYREHPVHGLIHTAVLDLAEQGFRHDANAVSKLMTLRGQLYDPEIRGQLRVTHAGGERPLESPARYLKELEVSGRAGVPGFSWGYGQNVAGRSHALQLATKLEQAAAMARAGVATNAWHVPNVVQEVSQFARYEISKIRAVSR